MSGQHRNRIFGAIGPASPFARDELLQHGRRVTGREPGATQTGSGRTDYLVWADAIASRECVTIATSGSVRMRGDDSPATAAGLVDAYLQAGIGFLQQLTGSFEIVIIDERDARVVLAIDPMGIGRLAYTQRDGFIVFSTSAEDVAKSPGVWPALNHQAIFDYLVHHVIPAPDTIFRGVSKLPPASHVVFAGEQVRVQRHWQPEFRDQDGDSAAGLTRRLHESLRHAVATCQPDDTTGAFLSGGLDSSTVAGLLSEAQQGRARTFTIGFGYTDYDELPYSRIANARFGCEANEYVIHGTDIATTFALIAEAYDEPFGNSSALPVYHCARMARERGVHHLLAGDGGDELFAGNSRYADQQVFEWYGLVPSLLRGGLLEPALRAWPFGERPWLIRKAKRYVEQASIPLPARLETWNFVYRLGAATILDPQFLASIDPNGPFERMQRVWDSTPGNSSLQRMLYYDWHYTLADNDLRKVEVMSGLAGVRVSYPMLDHRVVDLSTQIAPGTLMPGRKLRDFYKRAMTGYLPDEIIHKKKHGFGLPFGLWLQESAELRDVIYGNLAALRSRNIVRPDFLNRILDLHGHEDARYYGVFIWVLAMLEQWLELHHGSSGGRASA